MKNIIRTFYILFITLFLATCSEVGIFYSLEKEEKILDPNNLNNSATFSNLVLAGTDYYIGNAGKNIYFRSTNSSSTDTTVDDWSALTLPTGAEDSVSGEFASDATVTSMALLGNQLLISRISYDGSSVVSGIYRLADATIDLSTVTSASWEMVVKSPLDTNKSDGYTSNVYKLFVAQSNIYINHLTYTFDSENDNSATINDSLLYTTTTPDFATVSNDLTNIPDIDISAYAQDDDGVNMVAAVTDITSSGSNYWLIINGESTGNVWTDTNADLSTATNTTSSLNADSTPAAAAYVDIYEVDATRTIISNTNGSLYIYDGASYIELTKGNAYLNGFADINSLAANNLIVGTSANVGDSTYDGEGYYQLDISDADEANWDWVDTDNNFSEINNYNSSDLASASVNGFLFDSANSRLFAYTRNAGVWMNELDVSDRIWSLE